MYIFLKLDIGDPDVSKSLFAKYLLVFFLFPGSVEISWIFIFCSTTVGDMTSVQYIVQMPKIIFLFFRGCRIEIIYPSISSDIVTFGKKQSFRVTLKIFPEWTWSEIHSPTKSGLRMDLTKTYKNVRCSSLLDIEQSKLEDDFNYSLKRGRSF